MWRRNEKYVNLIFYALIVLIVNLIFQDTIVLIISIIVVFAYLYILYKRYYDMLDMYVASIKNKIEVNNTIPIDLAKIKKIVNEHYDQ